MHKGELQELIEKGEGERLEFKRSFQNDAVETVVAFANSHGGSLIERYGSGIGRIDDACKKAGIPPPKIVNQGGGFTVIFSKTPTDTSTGVESSPELQPESRPESQPESLETRVLSALKDGPMAKSSLSAGLGQKEVSSQLNKVMRDLLADSTVEHTIPDKPNSRLQKYRITEKGKSLLEDRSSQDTGQQ